MSDADDRHKAALLNTNNNNNDEAGLHVLIVGAGVVGLLVAQGLKKHGVSCAVYEAEPTASYYRSREWGVSIQWALPMLQELLPTELLGERLQSTSVDPFYVFPDSGNSMPAYNAQTGEVIKRIPLVKLIRVSRHKFRTLCCEGIDVQYNKRVLSTSVDKVTSRVTLHFSDNTTATGTTIIGTDGAKSLIRICAFAPDAAAAAAIRLPFKALNLHVHYNDATTARFLHSKLGPIVAIGHHPKGYWLWLSQQDVPDPKRPETWVFQLQWSWDVAHCSTDGVSGAATPSLEALKRVAREEFAEPWRTAWDMIPEGTEMCENNISLWQPVPVPETSALKGIAVMAGDAAHPMSFHRGQGMNHGIADAVKLVAELVEVNRGSKSQREGLDAYDSEMVFRAGEEVRVSKLNSEMVHDWDRLMESPFMKIHAVKST